MSDHLACLRGPDSRKRGGPRPPPRLAQQVGWCRRTTPTRLGPGHVPASQPRKTHVSHPPAHCEPTWTMAFPLAPAPLPLPAAQPQTTVKAQQHNRATEPLTAHMPLLSTQPRRFVSPERTSELRVLLTSEPAALRPGHLKRSRHTQRVPEQPSALHPDSHLFQLLPPCQPCWSQGGCP